MIAALPALQGGALGLAVFAALVLVVLGIFKIINPKP